jgi:hypothetical protein
MGQPVYVQIGKYQPNTRMKNNSEFGKASSVLMLFIFLIEFTGCSSTNIIQTSDITSSETYLIHCNKASYPVYDVEIIDSIFSGKINLTKMNNGTGIKSHIYLAADSVLKFTNDIISFPVKYISRIEQKVPDAGKTKALTTALIVVGCVGMGVGLIVLISTVTINAATTSIIKTINSSNGCKIM